jgi:hypothetical protein
MRFAATLACLLACGCTRANSHYIDDSSAPGDNDFGLADLSATPGMPCSGDARDCLGAGASAFCSGGSLALDRTCPAQSTCVATYCAPPASKPLSQVGERCDVGGGPRESLCRANLAEMLSCQPFVAGGTRLQFYCDTSVGPGGAGTRCTQGSECRSGFCADNRYCFAGCQSDLDCPARPLHCVSVHITVEGVTESTKSCGT